MQPGDVARGAALHESYLSCHGTDIYTAKDRKMKSLNQLQKEVKRWCDCHNPRMSTQEMKDLVVYLNVNFYKFQDYLIEVLDARRD